MTKYILSYNLKCTTKKKQTDLDQTSICEEEPIACVKVRLQNEREYLQITRNYIIPIISMFTT